MNVFDVLNQPCYYNDSWGKRLRTAAFFGIFVFLFLYLFQPFHLNELSDRRLLFIVGVFGGITFTSVLLSHVLLPPLFPSFFNEKEWTTGRQILITLIVVMFVGLANYVFALLLFNGRLNWKDALWYQGVTLAIAALPVVIYLLIRQNILLRKFSEQAQDLEKKLQEKQEKKTEVDIQPMIVVEGMIELKGDYQNEQLRLMPDDVCLVVAASNYIKIYHQQNGKIIYSILRSTLKKAEESLMQHSCFFKCHRAFIINLDKVLHIEGNAQGYKLRIDGYDEPVPVSRNLNSEFSDKLLAFRGKDA